VNDPAESPTESLLQELRAAVPAASLEPAASVDMPAIYVDREHVLELFRALRDTPSLQFTFLSDLTAVDYLPAEPRFEVVYHFASLGAAYAPAGSAAPARRLRVKVRLFGADATMPSVSSLYPTAGWPEREVYDLFGIGFEGHPDLRRILMPDEWEGHPLRKDYPVQIRKETPSWSALQMTPGEFVANIQAARDRATRELKDA
jgi:NADH-quinone oxidoreductase subunit C